MNYSTVSTLFTFYFFQLHFTYSYVRPFPIHHVPMCLRHVILQFIEEYLFGAIENWAHHSPVLAIFFMVNDRLRVGLVDAPDSVVLATDVQLDIADDVCHSCVAA